ncbi:MAG: hypothetical protein IT478_05755, partial [Xanthomonadales bacterium]|nr:hypothetical protein [Xanthomonadales bacterium]
MAMLLMLGSVLMLPISAISALMLFVGSHGTAHAEAGGIFLIVVAPGLTLVAGFGLWRRQRWAHVCVVLLLVAVLVAQGLGWWRGPTPQHTTVSASGTVTTVMAAPAAYSPLLTLVAVALIAFLLQPWVRAECYRRRSTTSPTGPDAPPPLPAASAPVRDASPPERIPTAESLPDASGRGALITGAIGLIAFALLMGWLVWHGLGNAEIWWPARHASARRMVSRAEAPLLYWTALGLYAALGT